MNRERLKQLFPRASESCIRANCSNEAAIVESASGNAALATPQTQAPGSGKFLVIITSIRKRLLDEDNLCEKYFVDCCRYAGVLPDDSPDQTTIQVQQRKAAKGEKEETVVEVYKL